MSKNCLIKFIPILTLSILPLTVHAGGEENLNQEPNSLNTSRIQIFNQTDANADNVKRQKIEIDQSTQQIVINNLQAYRAIF